jgi:excisionase family DNA binding protein
MEVSQRDEERLSADVTVQQVAERLEVSPQLVYALVAAGKLACTRHGLGRGVIRISEEQLAEYLAGVAQKEAPPRRPPSPTRSFRFLDASKLGEAWKRRG